MKVLDLNCNQCGAPLEVPAKARFVTCSFCNTRLQIQHQGAAAYTEVLEEMSGDIQQIRRDVAIQRLDQEWMIKRERYVRVVVDRGTQNAVIDFGLAVQTARFSEPVQHDSSTVVGTEFHQAPAEGTA